MLRQLAALIFLLAALAFICAGAGLVGQHPGSLGSVLGGSVILLIAACAAVAGALWLLFSGH